MEVTDEHPISNGQWAARLNLDVTWVYKLRPTYLNVMKLENYGPTVECLNNNH